MGQPLVLHLICWQQNPRKPRTQCFVLGIAGMGGNSGLYKLVSSSCSPYTLSTLGKECPQIFQYLLVLFVLVRLQKVAVYNYSLRTYICVLSNVLMGLPLFSLLSRYFLSINFWCEWYQMASVPSHRTAWMPFVPVASKVFVCGKPPLEPRCDVGPQNCQWIAFGSSVSLWVWLVTSRSRSRSRAFWKWMI